jgi:hypothetical protein
MDALSPISGPQAPGASKAGDANNNTGAYVLQQLEKMLQEMMGHLANTDTMLQLIKMLTNGSGTPPTGGLNQLFGDLNACMGPPPMSVPPTPAQAQALQKLVTDFNGLKNIDITIIAWAQQQKPPLAESQVKQLETFAQSIVSQVTAALKAMPDPAQGQGGSLYQDLEDASSGNMAMLAAAFNEYGNAQNDPQGDLAAKWANLTQSFQLIFSDVQTINVQQSSQASLYLGYVQSLTSGITQVINKLFQGLQQQISTMSQDTQ